MGIPTKKLALRSDDRTISSAGLKYLTPQEYWEGEPEQRLEERRESLARARTRREGINRARLQAAA